MVNKQELMKELKNTIKNIEKITEKLETLEKQESANIKKNDKNKPLFWALEDMEKSKFNTILDLHSTYFQFEKIQEMKKRLKEGRDLINGNKI